VLSLCLALGRGSCLASAAGLWWDWTSQTKGERAHVEEQKQHASTSPAGRVKVSTGAVIELCVRGGLEQGSEVKMQEL